MTTQDSTFDQDAIEIEWTEVHPNDFRIHFEVPAEQVARFIRQLRGVEAKIPPQQIATLLITVAIEEGLFRADRERIWAPSLSPKTPSPVLHPEKPFVGTFDCDGFAQPAWPDLSLITLGLPPIEVTDELVEREMLDQRLDAGKRKPLEGPLEIADECDVTVEVRLGDASEPVIQVSRRPTRIPPAGFPLNVGGLLLEGGECLVGHRAGETVTFESTLPHGLPNPELDGRTVEVRIEILETRRIDPLEEEEVVKQYGAASGAQLRNQIRFALDQRRAEERRSIATRQITDQLLTLVPLDIPTRVIERAISERLSANRKALLESGLEESAIEEKLTQDEPRIRETAPGHMHRRAVYELLKTHLGVTWTEEDLLSEIRRIANMSGRRPEEVRQELVSSGRLEKAQEAALTGRIVERVMAEATII